MSREPSDPPDDAVLVRGGTMTPERLLRRAKRDQPKLAELGISLGISAFAGSASTTLEELVTLAPIPHDTLQKTTVGRVRAAGFEVRRTFAWPHCTIDLGDTADEDAASRLIDAFDPPEPTPGKGAER